MPFQIALCAPCEQGSVDCGLGLSGNLYETRAMAEKARAMRYGADDCWSVVVDAAPQPPQPPSPWPARGPYLDDDIPF